jgi:CDK inhibitor PHO81
MPSRGGQDVEMQTSPPDDLEIDASILQAITVGNLTVIQDWAKRISPLPDSRHRITKVFLSTADEASEDILKALLETNLVKIDEVDEINHRNLLHKASLSGRMILLQIGLSHSVDVRAADVYGRIPLHYACMHGFKDMIQELLAAGLDTIDFKDHDNFTPLIHSIVHSHVPCLEILLAHNARIDPISEAEHIPLNLACQHGSYPVVEHLLHRNPQMLPDAEGLYPQHLVARSSKDPRLLLLLRDYGANLDQPDKLYQWTPLFHAASEGKVECLQTLLKCGANPTILDEKGLSALYYATWEGHLECMELLTAMRPPPTPPPPKRPSTVPLPTLKAPSSTPGPMSKEADNIPLFILPPPIIPVRRYGHSFLESKFFVVLRLGSDDGPAIQFYEDNKYPAARITISSKSSDLIPRNLLLPLQDDAKTVSFQIDNLDTFSIDFDIYPSFGARVIARAVVSSPVFTNTARSSDTVYLELLDPRLRAIGRINFNFLVVRPFQGIPLEITHFSTYWKATKQTDSHPGALIAGSSLSGDYVRLFVQVTKDGVPVLYPQWNISLDDDLQIPINFMTYKSFERYGAQQLGGPQNLTSALHALSNTDSSDIRRIHAICAQSYSSLNDVLLALPAYVHVELHILYPHFTECSGSNCRSGPACGSRVAGGASSCPINISDINTFTDAILRVVFDHARRMRENTDGFQRSIVFSSFNPDLCTALNWKQPNCQFNSTPILPYIKPIKLLTRSKIPSSSATPSASQPPTPASSALASSAAAPTRRSPSKTPYKSPATTTSWV